MVSNPENSSAGDNAPLRRLRSRRDSTPVPTELADTANALAVAFHVSACLDGAPTDVLALGSYWGAGRRKAREAKDILLDRGLWFEVRVPQRDGNEWGGWDVEYRAVETRATDRDLAELALEYPTGTRISTAGGTWRVNEDGGLTPLSGSTTNIGPVAGQRSETETGHRPQGSTTNIGPVAGQRSETETGHRPQGSTTNIGPVAGQRSETETGHPSRARTPSAPSGRSGRRERPEGATKPAADAAAGTSQEDMEVTDWARLLVRALPWSQRMPQGRVLRASEARELAAAFRRAADVHHYTEDQIRDWALDRLHASNGKNPVTWVLNAFTDAALDREPVVESLQLPEETWASTNGEERQDNDQRAHPAEEVAGSMPEWCGRCGDGDPRAEFYLPLRRVEDANGDMVPCRCTRPGWQHEAA